MTAKRHVGDPRHADEAVTAAREAKASVREAIGKLIGDDAVERRGAVERRAGAGDGAGIGPPR